MGNSTTYPFLIHLKSSQLIYHTSKLSSASTHACISLSKANREYSIGLSMARAFNAHCEFGVVFKPSSALLQSMLVVLINCCVSQNYPLERETHASLLLFAGVSIASVARRLGHASMTTTQKTYLHIIQELENKDVDLVMRTLSGL